MPHGRVALTIDLYSMQLWASSTAAPVAPMPEVAPPHAILPPPEGQYYGMQHGRAGPMIDPHSMQHRVLNSHRELFGTEATMERGFPTLDHIGLPAPNDPYYIQQNQRMYVTEDTSQIVHDQYSRYRAVEEIVCKQLPSKREGEYNLHQNNVVGCYRYLTAALPQVSPPMHPNAPVCGRPEWLSGLPQDFLSPPVIPFQGPGSCIVDPQWMRDVRLCCSIHMLRFPGKIHMFKG